MEYEAETHIITGDVKFFVAELETPRIAAASALDLKGKINSSVAACRKIVNKNLLILHFRRCVPIRHVKHCCRFAVGFKSFRQWLLYC
jgi:hypothetical protein